MGFKSWCSPPPVHPTGFKSWCPPPHPTGFKNWSSPPHASDEIQELMLARASDGIQELLLVHLTVFRRCCLFIWKVLKNHCTYSVVSEKQASRSVPRVRFCSCNFWIRSWIRAIDSTISSSCILIPFLLWTFTWLDSLILLMSSSIVLERKNNNKYSMALPYLYGSCCLEWRLPRRKIYFL